MSPYNGKRVKNRFQVLDCNVRLQLRGLFGRFGNETFCASLIDLSASGMQVVSYDMLNSQKQYDIAIYTPAFRFPISTKGQVVWQRPYDGKDANRYYRIGFEFTYFKGRAIEHLEKLEYSPKLRQMQRT